MTVGENGSSLDCQAETVPSRFGSVMGDDGSDNADVFNLEMVLPCRINSVVLTRPVNMKLNVPEPGCAKESQPS